MSDLDNFDGYVDFSERGALPKCPGIYLVTDNGLVVYVGQSVNVKRRFIHHHRRIEFAELNDPKVYWKSCIEEELQQTERDYINKFNPRLNIGGTTGGQRPGAGRKPSPKPFNPRFNDWVIIERSSINEAKFYEPELGRVCGIANDELELQIGNEILVIRVPDNSEIEVSIRPKM